MTMFFSGQYLLSYTQQLLTLLLTNIKHSGLIPVAYLLCLLQAASTT